MVAQPVDFVARRRMMAVEQGTARTKGASAGIFGEAQSINARLKQMRLAGNARVFLDHLTAKTLNWGGEEAKGRDIYATEIATATWGRELREDTENSVWTTSNVKHMIDRLAAHGIVRYEPDYARPGYGIIAWNRNLDEWQPFERGGQREGAGSGGSRPGAGRPKNQSSVQRKNQSTIQRTTTQNQSSVQRKSIKCTTDNCHEDSGGVGLSAPLRNDQETISKNGDANASLGADANAPVAEGGKSHTPAKEKKSKRPREPDPYWDALVELCGPAEGREKVYGRIAQDIKDMGGIAEDIPIRAANWYRLYPGATRTIFALRKFWHELATEAVDAELARQAAAKAEKQRGANNGQHQPVQVTQAARGRPRRTDPNEGVARRACDGDND